MFVRLVIGCSSCLCGMFVVAGWLLFVGCCLSVVVCCSCLIVVF